LRITPYWAFWELGLSNVWSGIAGITFHQLMITGTEAELKEKRLSFCPNYLKSALICSEIGH
jgi:hypothetical protein